MKEQEGNRTPRFTDNFGRLLGLHALSQHTAAKVLGVSPATINAWMQGKTVPSLQKAIGVAELFGIPTERLMNATFPQLLEKELADPERYERTERRLHAARARLKSV